MVAVQSLIRHINIYRVITVVGFIVAVVLVMVVPAQMSGASPWAYYYGVKNFSHGQLTIDDQTYFRQAYEAQRQGGALIYVKIGPNKWAVEKPPGYIFYLVPFELMGIPRWGNVLLALGMVIVTYILLKRLRDELTACIGSLFILFTGTGKDTPLAWRFNAVFRLFTDRLVGSNASIELTSGSNFRFALRHYAFNFLFQR